MAMIAQRFGDFGTRMVSISRDKDGNVVQKSISPKDLRPVWPVYQLEKFRDGVQNTRQAVAEQSREHWEAFRDQHPELHDQSNRDKRVPDWQHPPFNKRVAFLNPHQHPREPMTLVGNYHGYEALYRTGPFVYQAGYSTLDGISADTRESRTALHSGRPLHHHVVSNPEGVAERPTDRPALDQVLTGLQAQALKERHTHPSQIQHLDRKTQDGQLHLDIEPDRLFAKLEKGPLNANKFIFEHQDHNKNGLEQDRYYVHTGTGLIVDTTITRPIDAKEQPPEKDDTADPKPLSVDA